MKRMNLVMLSLLSVMSHQAYALNCPMPSSHTGAPTDDTVDQNGGTAGMSASTEGRDIILTFDGNDTVYALGGDDCIDAGEQDDYVEGGAGRDWLFGTQGRDILYGGDDNDYVSGGNNNDIVYGGNGHDDVLGGEGNDEVYGDAGNDTMYGNGGNDNMNGGPGNDVMYGGDGFDVLISGGGADILDGGSGYDSCYGGVVYVNCTNVPDTPTLKSAPLLSQLEILDAGDGDDTLILHAGTKVMAMGGEGNDVFKFHFNGNTATTLIKIVDSQGNNRLEFPKAYSSDIGWKNVGNGEVMAFSVATGKSLMVFPETTLNSMQAIKFEDKIAFGVDVLNSVK